MSAERVHATWDKLFWPSLQLWPLIQGRVRRPEEGPGLGLVGVPGGTGAVEEEGLGHPPALLKGPLQHLHHSAVAG